MYIDAVMQKCISSLSHCEMALEQFLCFQFCHQTFDTFEMVVNTDEETQLLL